MHPSVSVNGNDVVTFTGQCQESSKRLDALTDQERAAITEAKQQFQRLGSGNGNILSGNVDITGNKGVISFGGRYRGNNNIIGNNINSNNINFNNVNSNNIGNTGDITIGDFTIGDTTNSNININGYNLNGLNLNGQQAKSFSSIRFSLSRGQVIGISSSNMGISTYNRDSTSLVKLGDHSLSMSRPDLANGMAMLFVDGTTGGVASFVYKDARVAMKPVDCLDQSESSLIQQVRKELEEAEKNAWEEREQRKVERELERQQREREKEQRRLERELEREQRQREKEQRRQEKEQERERRRQEKEMRRSQRYQ